MFFVQKKIDNFRFQTYFMKFLSAEWRKLAIFNYEVSPSLLEPYLPMGTELDLFEGKCYVSMVGFLFKNTKLLTVLGA